MVDERVLPRLEELATTLIRTRAGREFAPVDFAELMNTVLGLTMEKSSEICGQSEETVRTRRKRIYKRLQISGAQELVQQLLVLALQQELERSSK